MSVEMACNCEDLPSHSHIGRWTPGDKAHGYVAHWEDTGELRMWVDWKAVARALSKRATLTIDSAAAPY